MATDNLRQRTKLDDSDNITTDTTTTTSVGLKKPDKRRMAMAKRGLRSLAIAVALPLSLTILNIYLFGFSQRYTKLSKPFWFPPLWMIHLTCTISTLLMGLSAWLVWAEGGFHNNPTALSLYLAQFGLSLVWNPITLWMGASWVGLVVCLGMFGALAGCCRVFRQVNPIAADLVKMCLAWAAFLAADEHYQMILSAIKSDCRFLSTSKGSSSIKSDSSKDYGKNIDCDGQYHYISLGVCEIQSTGLEIIKPYRQCKTQWQWLEKTVIYYLKISVGGIKVHITGLIIAASTLIEKKETR
ncbi:hypothetical protein ACFE04_018559 [Oxalis oulophora]